MNASAKMHLLPDSFRNNPISFTLPDSKGEEERSLWVQITENAPGTILLIHSNYCVGQVMSSDGELGLTEEIVGHRIDALPGVLYPGKIGKRIVSAVKSCLEEDKTLDRQFPMRREAGDLFHLKVRMVPVLHKYVLVYLCNQTGLVEAEKENRRLSVLLSERHNMMKLALEKSNVSAFSFDFDKQMACDKVHCKRCFQFYGTTNKLLERNKYICRAMTVLRHPDDTDNFFTLFNRLREQQLSESKVSFRLKNNAGEYRHYEVCGKVQEYDEHGHARLIIGTITDNQDQKEYEHSLIQAKEKAETADQLKSAYLANMTHEIRTPLHAIVAFSDLLSAEDDPETREEYLTLIKANNELLMGLVNDVLDISKIEANMMTFSPVPLYIPAWMQEAYQTLNLRTPPGVELIMDVCAPVTVETDKKRLTQVLTNLVTNAMKHTKAGSIRFGYTLEPGQIRFYVADTGTGIPQNQLEEIFSRFVQLKGSKQGIGLGLAICKGLVNRMGGTISATSEIGKGSTFAFTLPRQK